MPAPILIATTNAGKLREIRQILGDLPIELQTLRDLPDKPEPEETGRTFAENALLKARYYGTQHRIITIAEDSGLAIDALSGRPGVASARYPGDTYPEKFARLYGELHGHPCPWTARFVCSAVVVDPAGNVLFTCEATIEGEIAPEPRGTNGFGYDPIFFFPPYGRTLGEVSDPEKLAVAHRGKAFRQIREWLRGQLFAAARR
jgi:XTP/dITP diphosphohydrolase